MRTLKISYERSSSASNLMVSNQPLWTHTVAASFDPHAEAVIAPGDCLATLGTLPDSFAKLIITSPPYNLGKAYEKTAKLDCYLQSLDPIVDELARVLAPDGSICWQVGNYVEDGEVFPLDMFYRQFKERGFKLRNRIIWHFEHGLHASKRFSGRYELCCGSRRAMGRWLRGEMSVPPAVAGGCVRRKNPPATAGGTDLLSPCVEPLPATVTRSI